MIMRNPGWDEIGVLEPTAVGVAVLRNAFSRQASFSIRRGRNASPPGPGTLGERNRGL